MSATRPKCFQCLTLVLVFFMGMFIMASMFFTFPTMQRPIGDNINAAKLTLSSFISGTTSKKYIIIPKGGSEEQFSDESDIESDAMIFAVEDGESSSEKEKQREEEVNNKIKDSKFKEETQEESGFTETATHTRRGGKKKLKKTKFEINSQPYTPEYDTTSVGKESDNVDDKRTGARQRDSETKTHEDTQRDQLSDEDSDFEQDMDTVKVEYDKDDVGAKVDEKPSENTDNKGKNVDKSSDNTEEIQRVRNNDDNRNKKGKNRPKDDDKELTQDINKKIDDSNNDTDRQVKKDESWKTNRFNKKKNDEKDKNSEKEEYKTKQTDNEDVKKERKVNEIKRDIPLWDKTEEKDLLDIFLTKLRKIERRGAKLGDTCVNKRTISNSCQKDGCLQMKQPSKPDDRIKQLTHRPGLTLTDPQHAILHEMASHVTETYDIILLTTASSNHFLESQALLQNLHQNVFPVLKNFALLFYDIGLAPAERKEMEKFCRCKVLSFPFDKLPDYIRNLKCYAWKPLMIKAHIRQANVVLWLDASIRFNGDASQLQALIAQVRKRGVQIGRSSADSPFRTFRSMYHYFGDEPCMYLGMGQAQATIGGYHSEPFVDRVILEPWVACALNQGCMCPVTNRSAGCAESKKMAENLLEHNGPIIYGLCHRFDQSAITLILHKLYQSQYRHVMMRVKEYGRIERDNEVEYFKTLYK